MKKKLLAMLLVAGLVFTGCGGSKKDDGKAGEAKDDKKGSTYELALITDVGTIDDKSFNQGSWEGVEQYGKEKNLTHKYYQPAEKTTQAYNDSIDLAIKNGAKVVVTPGYLFEPSVYTKQTQYPDVKFILIDGAPRKDAESKPEVAKNTVSITYAEEEAGFLAGYALIKEGYKKIGFLGGMAMPAVIRYGYGYVQGAEYAAKEMNESGIEITYSYLGNFNPLPENQSKAASLFQAGTEVIFACAGGAGNSVMKAAESTKGKVVGVDVDQSSESNTVITSSMKLLKNSVYEAIKSIYDNTFKGGESLVLGAKDKMVGLPMETSKFSKFTKEDYENVYKKLESGEIKLKKDADESGKSITLDSFKSDLVTIKEIN